MVSSLDIAPPRDPLIPKDFLLGPVFAAAKQNGPRTVVIPSKGLEYTIGGFHPLRPELMPPALDVRHARATFAILTFRDIFESKPSFSFSLNELCHRYARSNGGRYSREIKSILADLIDAFFKVTDLKTGKHRIYRIIERIDIEGRGVRRNDAVLANGKQLEMWFHGVTLSPEFFDILQDITELQHLKLDVMTGMTSNLAQAIYLYIPSRAHHHSRSDPFKITLSNLLGQVGSRVPVKKSLRRQVFTQNANPVLSQLDGSETLSGTFRVDLQETKDGSDFNFLAWVDKPQKKERKEADSALIRAYLEGGRGRTRAKAQKLITERSGLDDYDLSLLERAGVVLEGNETFFEMAKALLGSSRFQGLAAEAKGDFLEGRKATKTPNARLGFRIMEALKS
jgi:hypothetical protein